MNKNTHVHLSTNSYGEEFRPSLRFGHHVYVESETHEVPGTGEETMDPKN